MNNNNGMEVEYSNSRPKRNKKTEFEARIDEIANKIVYLVNKNTIFEKGLKLNVKIDGSIDGINVLFYLNDETYVNAVYYNTNPLSGTCTYVNSDLGMKTGTFLFHLLLLLTVKLGVEDFTLDNYTDDQVRGALGIYKLLSVNKRGEDRDRFTRASLEQQLYNAMGKMRLESRGDTEKRITDEIYNIMTKLKNMKIGDNDVWQPKFDKGIVSFLNQWHQQGLYGGKKKSKKTKSKKIKSKKTQSKKHNQKNTIKKNTIKKNKIKKTKRKKQK